MASTSMLVWDQGFPYEGLDTGVNAGSMQIWDQGFSYQFNFQPSSTVIGLLTLLGVG